MSRTDGRDRGGRIAILHEHPEWVRPLFHELERRGVEHEAVDMGRHRFDPAEPAPRWSLVLNRMSPSAHLRGHPGAVPHTLSYLAHLEERGVRIVNGSRAFRFETSKARQLSLLDALGVPYPAARAIHRAADAPAAAGEIRFPVIVKPNVGGCGAGIRRFDRAAELEAAVRDGRVDLGPDGTALVQELVPRRDDAIVRIEVVGGEFLYAIRVTATEGCFDLCPADIRGAGDASGRVAEPFRPPEPAIEQALRIAEAAGMEVAGVEYLVDERDGMRRFYDVNGNSNFVADADALLGFDPFSRLVDFLEREADVAAAVAESEIAAAGPETAAAWPGTTAAAAEQGAAP